MKRSPLWSSRVLAVAAAASALATAAYAGPVDELLMRNARLQSRITQDLAAARIDPTRAAHLQDRAAEIYRMQAQALANAKDSQQHEQLVQAQRDLAGAITWAEKHPARDRGTALDRTRLRVASMRNAEQQRLIARGLRDGRLSEHQVMTLETAQAQIAAAESDAASGGNVSRDEARAMQGAQDLQDYTIKQNPQVAELLIRPPEGEETQPQNLSKAGPS